MGHPRLDVKNHKFSRKMHIFKSEDTHQRRENKNADVATQPVRRYRMPEHTLAGGYRGAFSRVAKNFEKFRRMVVFAIYLKGRCARLRYVLRQGRYSANWTQLCMVAPQHKNYKTNFFAQKKHC